MERPGADRQAAGIDYDALIAEILSGAIRRYKERERERRTGSRSLDLEARQRMVRRRFRRRRPERCGVRK